VVPFSRAKEIAIFSLLHEKINLDLDLDLESPNDEEEIEE
jgi:hypothetical protein